MIAYDCFIHSYLHKRFCHLTILNVVVGVHSENDVVAIVTEVTQEVAQVSDE